MIDITVFTPTYNRAYTLNKCYESLIRQTCKNFKWLIIDDGSTDNTRELVKGWIAESDFEISYVFKENQGMSAAHNTAYELIDTELNVCIDSDDYMADDAIEKITLFWRRNGNDSVSGIVALNAGTDGKIIGTNLPGDISMSTLNDLYLKYKCKGDKKIIYRTALTRKHPYPLFQDEKYMPLNYKYALLDLEYKLLLLNETVCIVEYMDDGSSRNIIKQYRNNPKSFSLYRKIYIRMSKNIIFKFRQCIHYTATSLISKDKAFISDSPAKILTLLAFFPGLLLYLYIMKTKRAGFMNKPASMASSPTKILQVTGGMNVGGAETMIMHLYRKLDKSKIQFDFITFTKEKSYFDDEICAQGGNIYYVAPPQETGPIRFSFSIYKAIKHNGPYHAVHAHTLMNTGMVLLAARFAGVKFRVCHSHSTLSEYKNAFIKKIYFMVMRIFIKYNSNRNIACTEAAGKFLFGQKSVAGQDFNILPNAIDLAPYKNTDLEQVSNMRKILGIKEDTLAIGHVGRFCKVKNQIFLVNLAEYLNNNGVDFKIILIGQGSLKHELEEIVEARHLHKHITFLGIQTNIHLYMRLFNVFVFPSLYEGLGIVLIEAQAAGTPCVISDTIPVEVDMGLGLVKMLSLKEPFQKWYEGILSSIQKEKIPTEITAEVIMNKGYNLDNTVKMLNDIYGLPIC